MKHIYKVLQGVESAMFHVLADRGFNSKADYEAMKQAHTEVQAIMQGSGLAMSQQDVYKENLVLTIINDGNGVQCGKSYNERLDMARNRTLNPNAWVQVVNRCILSILRGENIKACTVLAAAAEIAKYYDEHLTEL